MELDFMKAALLEHVNERLEQDGAIERIVLTLMEGDGSNPPTPITSER
jgi:hypothetical protein